MAKKKAVRKLSRLAKARKSLSAAIGALPASKKKQVAKAVKDISLHSCAVKLGARGGRATAAKKRAAPKRRKR
jgi:hypothetical protein